MSRKSWVEVEEARLLETNTREKCLLGRAIRETIEECASIAEMWSGKESETTSRIWALLEPGDEGEGG